MRQILAEASNGQQVLVTLWDKEGEEPEVALRGDSGLTWGPPLKILNWDREETDGTGKRYGG